MATTTRRPSAAAGALWERWRGDMEPGTPDHERALVWFYSLYEAGLDGKPRPVHPGARPLTADEWAVYEQGLKDAGLPAY